MKPFALSIACLAAGAAISQLVPLPWSGGAFWLGVFTGLAALTRKHRKILLRFGRLSWTKEEICRHILITGDTGSGKTTSGFHPILLQITKNDPAWGGLVLGVKGDEHRFVAELLDAHGRQADLIHLQVRPDDCSTKWTPPHRYNLISDRSIPWMTHAKAIVDLASSMTEGAQHAFFRPIAQIALAHSFELLDESGLPVTIARAYEVLTNKEVAAAMIKPFLRAGAPVRQRQIADFFTSTITQARASEQREAIEGTIKTYLGFLLDPDVINVFSSDLPNTFSFSQLDSGSIISITMPQRLVTERRYIQTYLKTLFYYHVLRRFDKSPEEFRKTNLLLLVADEFQNIVTASEDGISDHNIIDRIRAAGAAIIGGMQSEISADPAIGPQKRKVLSLNMRSRLIFRAAESEGAVSSAEFIGKKKIWKTSKTTRSMGSGSTTRHVDEDYCVKPSALMNLAQHVAIVVHPSKVHRKLRIPPLDGRGRSYPWYRS